MDHFSFKDLGKSIVATWGKVAEEDSRSLTIKNMVSEQKNLAVLCYMASLLESMNYKLSAKPHPPASSETIPPEAWSRWIKEHLSLQEDVAELPSIPAPAHGSKEWKELGSRAQTTMLRLNSRLERPPLLSDLTPENLLLLKNCGTTTAHEIIKWRDHIISTLPPLPA